MAYFYIPREDNLCSLNDDELDAIFLGVANLRNGKLPWRWKSDLLELRFFVDNGMAAEAGILGYTKFTSDCILLSPIVVRSLMWKDVNGFPNNEWAMSVIIHELTHRQQMSWCFGLVWPLLNMPTIDTLTIEKWARENEIAAKTQLISIYKAMRVEEIDEIH